MNSKKNGSKSKLNKTEVSLPQKHFQVIETGGVTWINIHRPTVSSLHLLQQRFPFLLDLDLRDCLPPFQRPKLLERENYFFIVLLFPIYDAKLRTVHPAEIDLFIGSDFIISSQPENLPALNNLANICQEQPKSARELLGQTSPEVLYNILHELIIAVFPFLTHLSNDILQVEREVFKKLGNDTVLEILRLRSNIVQCRQIMQGHKMVIRKFLNRSERIFNLKENNLLHYEDLIGHTKEIWDYLDNDKETIDAVYDSHTSLITHSTNRSSQRLAALALIIFPTTLVAAIFAMAADNMPIRGNAYDFWIMLGLVLTTMLATVTLLKWKRWL